MSLVRTETCRSGCDEEDANIPFAFGALLEQLILSMMEVFPECTAMADGKLIFQNTVLPFKDKLEDIMAQWKEKMKDDQLAFQTRDSNTVVNILHSIFPNMNFPDKMAQMDEESLTVLWEYLDNLNNYVNLWASIPKEIMDLVTNKAKEIATKINKGDISFEDINLKELGDSVLQNASKDQIDELAGKMGDICQALQGAGGAVGTPGGNINLGALASMMGGGGGA